VASPRTPKPRPNDDDQGGKVVKAGLLAALGFGSGIGSIFIAAGQVQVDNETVRFAIMNFTVVTALALLITAIWVWRH
jgi:hypothetical protein